MSSRPLYSAASLWQPDTFIPSAWIQHAPFGFWIVDALRPRLLVELGAHRGFSYLVFLQAVKELGVKCSCVAIDTWQGDEHAGFYDDSVLQQLRQQHDALYEDFSELLQSTFDDAVSRFADGSIDLLHLDGRHFYDDIKHDFETWQPKLSDRSIVLLHDTRVYSRTFGVHRLWEELSGQYPSFEFTHGHGLGVLGIGTNLPARVRELLETSKQPECATLVRQLYARLGKDTCDGWEQTTRISALQDANHSFQQRIDALTLAENKLGYELQQAHASLQLMTRQRDEAVTSVSRLNSDLASANSNLQKLDADLQKLNADLTRKDTDMKAIQASRTWRTVALVNKILAGLKRPGNLLRSGSRERRLIAKSGLFDTRWYLERYDDVRQAGADPIQHYLLFGVAEDRNPSPLFDTRWYLSKYPDVAESKENPFAHFIGHGWREGRDPNPVFDTDWYLATYPDVAAAGCNPLLHYLQFGAAEGRDPSPDFDTDWYAAQYPELSAKEVNPLAHYLTERRGVGRPATSVATGRQNGAPSARERRAAALFGEHFAGLRRLRVYNLPTAPRRVTMVTDSINSGYLFGGVATAMIFSAMWAERLGASLRIVTRHQKAEERNFAHVMKASGVSWERDVEFSFVPLSDDTQPIDVGAEEFFLTTSWWTTLAVKQAVGVERIVYLLQEDERMFYPFGDERLLCEEVLATPGLKFLVNARLLFDHLAATGVNVLDGNGAWFEPAFPESTFFYTGRANAPKFNFLFYARPNNLRNLFYRGLEVIERAIRRGILDPDLWDVHFVGKDLDGIVLSGGVRPTLHENLPWADYAALVRKTDIGLSLMYSPHPSYPPLDLAASGAVAVTNRYAEKQSLDAYSRNIICADIGIDSLVQGIADAVHLVNDPARRLQNYSNNGLLRSWETSFAKSFDFVSRGVFACS